MKIDRYYRPELNVLRFFAFLIVFVVHRMDFLPIDLAQHYWLCNLCRLGDLGVPVFFLLSVECFQGTGQKYDIRHACDAGSPRLQPESGTLFDPLPSHMI